jgi:hypothetical protein
VSELGFSCRVPEWEGRRKIEALTRDVDRRESLHSPECEQVESPAELLGDSQVNVCTSGDVIDIDPFDVSVRARPTRTEKDGGNTTGGEEGRVGQ